MKKRSSSALLDPPENGAPEKRVPENDAPENGSHRNGDGLDAKQLLAALTAFRRGDFSARLPDEWTGVAGKVADTFNDVIAMNQRMAREPPDLRNCAHWLRDGRGRS